MKHQNLISLELLVTKFLASMTNQAYSRNYKFSYKVTWEKGTSQIVGQDNKAISNYYVLSFYLIDKTESPVGNKVELYNNYYPTSLELSVNQLHEQALNDLLLNGVQSLANITFSLYKERQTQEIIKQQNVELDEKIEALRESSVLPKLDLKPVPSIIKDNNLLI